MSPLVRTIVFVIVGWLVGSVVNIAFVQLGPMIVEPPAGADMSTPAGINAAMPMFSLQHFIFPFLAHAVGALVGAYVATRWSRATTPTPALIVAFLFFLGGIAAVYMLPNTPMWYIVTDLVLAYFPMGMLGYKLGRQEVETTA